MSAEGKVPPVEFVEKKLRSYCKYQEEASKNKKCAPSPPALLRRKTARSRFAAVAQQRFRLQGRRDEAEQHVLLHRAGEAGLLHAGGQRCAPLPRRRHAPLSGRSESKARRRRSAGRGCLQEAEAEG